MPNTFTLINAVTVGAGGAANIDFTSIPSTYTDLCLKLSGRSSRSATTDSVFLKFNNTSSTYPSRRLYVAAGSVGSDAPSSTGFLIGGITGNTSTANTFSNIEVYAPNYTGNTNKSVSIDSVSEDNSTTGNFLLFNAGLWQDTSVINRITLNCDVGTFMQNSTAYLYGIVKS